jgi:hypothetical protein
MRVKSAPRILRLTIEQQYFDAIVSGTKRTEYRDKKDYWKTRLEGRKYDIVHFRNGYTQGVPEAFVEFRGLRKDDKRRYAIRLGKILKTRNLRRDKPQ